MVKTIDDRNKILTFFMTYQGSHSNVVKQFFKSRLFSIFCDTVFWDTESKFLSDNCGVAARRARVQVVSTRGHKGPTKPQRAWEAPKHTGLSYLVARPSDNTSAPAPSPRASTTCRPQLPGPQLPASGRVAGKRKWGRPEWDFRANQQHWYFSKTWLMHIWTNSIDPRAMETPRLACSSSNLLWGPLLS